MKKEGRIKEEDLQNMQRQARCDNLSNDLIAMEKIESMLQPHKEVIDTQFDKLKKGISSYNIKNDLPSYTPSDEKAGLYLSLAKANIRQDEGILSKKMEYGVMKYESTLEYIDKAKDEIEKHKNPEEVKKVKEEIVNFAEALARKIKMDIEKKDNEYSLKKDLKEEDKKDLKAYETERAKALKVAEKAINYAKKLIKESSHQG